MKRKPKIDLILPLVIVGFAVCFSMAVRENEQQIGCNDANEAKEIFLNERTALEKATETLRGIARSQGESYYYYLDLKPHIPESERPLFDGLMEGEFHYIDVTLTDDDLTACFELDSPPNATYSYYLIYADNEPPTIAQQSLSDKWYIGFIGYT